MMTRKQFLKVAGAGALGVAGSSLLSYGHSGPGRGRLEKNWAWMDGADPEDTTWGAAFARMKKAGIDGVLLKQEDPEVLRTVVPTARNEGLEVHVWMATMMRSENVEKHPDWYAVNRKGVSTAEEPPYVDYYHFLSPCVADVRDYLANHVDTLAKVEGVSGIHLDYIRFPDVILPIALQPKYDLDQDREFPRFDYGYHEACRAQFEAQTGTDPMDLEDPPAHERWLQFRYDQITQVVTRLAEVARGHDKKVSAAVFPTPDIARRLVRQNWPAWPLDAVMPMIYHNFYEKNVSWIEAATQQGVQGLEAGTPLYSGLFVPQLSPDELVSAAKRARAGGARGISLFDVGSMTDAHWNTVAGVLAT